jgi:pimeloyl-ACP methyl ester carboxylesterase
MHSKYVMVEGVRTHYLEAGSGPPLILLHSGEFGACAEISWEYNIQAFAAHFHVLAPDFVGFGRSDKLRDFGGHGARMLRHITGFLEVMCLGRADFVANSIAGRFLCRVASADHPVWPIRRMVCISGAGVEPANEARAALQSYDATREGMRAILRALFHREKWWMDETYLTRRYELSLLPGAWEVAAAARFKSPAVPPRDYYGKADTTAYANIRVPTLYVGGAQDRLVAADWQDLVSKTPHGESLMFDDCGHCANIECAEAFNRAALAFLTKEPA